MVNGSRRSADGWWQRWGQFILSLVIAAAMALGWVEAKVGSEAELRRDADREIKQEIGKRLDRIEGKLDRVIETR
jgi:hypothetical protein